MIKIYHLYCKFAKPRLIFLLSMVLVYTETVDSVEGKRWLARQTPNIPVLFISEQLERKWHPSLHPWQVKKSSKLFFLWCILSHCFSIQLFRERLSYKQGKAYRYVRVSQVTMGNGGFYGCLSKPRGVWAWWKETAQTHVFVLSRFLLPNHLELQSIKTKLLLPIMPIGIVMYAFTL